MPRIIGVDIPKNKRCVIAFTYIYGIGPATSQGLCEKLNIDPNMKADKLTDTNISAITTLLQEEFIIEGDLKRQIQQNIRRLGAIVSYRGIRHHRGLPVRGQRTKTNARTRKGGKRTVGAIRDKAARKIAGS
jgi:small subunit ribosomal protein S13